MDVKLQVLKMGDFSQRSDERNQDAALGVSCVRGISIDKKFIDTKANLEGVSLTSYKVVKPNAFAFVTVTSRNGEKISLALNDSQETFLVSATYEVFEINPSIILPRFLYLWFQRPEFDRYARFHSWGSARETFSFEDMRRIEIPVLDIEIQRQLVDVWEGLNRLKVDNEAQAEPLMGLCMSYLKKLREEYVPVPIGDFLIPIDERNTDNAYNEKSVRGIATSKHFIDTKANLEGVSLSNYKLVAPNRFAFVADTSRRGDKMSLAFNDTKETFIVSSISTVFEVVNDCSLLPEYLYLWFLRPEFDRYARYHSWGSARETFNLEDMKRVCIPIPDKSIQQAIVDIYKCAKESKAISCEAEKLRKAVAPALIQKAIHY